MNCPLCERVGLAAEGKYPFLIHEFPQSYLMLGEHQFFPGYCVLVAKSHYQEMSDMPKKMAEDMFREMMTVSRVLQKVFRPTKLNMCSLGNVVPHVHWHFFPRYSSDPQFKDPPWLRMHEFESAKITSGVARDLIEKIRKHF